MMHHPNMHHHQPMSGPPQHMPAHQGMPPGHQHQHQHVPPHAQMHRENRHVAITRVPMGPGQAGGGMGHGVGGAGGPGMHGHGHGHSHGHSHGHGQAAGGFGGMPVPHHAQQRPPHSHPIRAMPHHPPTHNHSVPPQQMKPLRRPYLGGGGYAGGGVMYPQPDLPPEPATQPHHTGLRKPPTTSSSIISPPTKAKIKPDFGIPSQPTPQASSATTVSETAATGDAGAGAGGGEAAGAGAGADAGAASDCEAGRAPPPANSKEKTPMCLVNELARYNKIKHQYRLTSETGPAHKKVFTVTLRLGDTEEYTAEGSSIKRAQHAAAQAALAGTGFPPPPPRAPPAHAPPHARHAGAVMPTVELNALAMKLCQPAVYTSVPPVAAPPAPRAPRPPRPPPYRLPPFMPNAYQRMLNPGLIYRVRVCVGGRAWLGEGATPQAARHDAAARALQDLRPPPDQPPGAANANTYTATIEGENGDSSVEILNAEVKSPVSLVHELALKRNLSVQFGVKSERGPPHMRVFVTTCTVGDMETEGEGNGKKVSKRRAAELMLAEMRRRWPAALLRARPPQDKRRPQLVKKKPRNLIKEGGVGSPETNGGGADNPISRLAVARHAVRARSPQYRVLEERGAARRREFLVQCDAPPHSATGLGPNKKTAKRRAAHNVLLAMEMANSGEANGTPSGNPDANGAGDAKTTNTDPKRKEGDASAGGAGGAGGEGRQPVPGVLLMDYHRPPQPAAPNGVSEPSATGGAGAGAGAAAGAGGGSPGAKDHLMYLAQLLGFTVQFSDFPKRNHGEYLSLVSLSTEPPVMCHGGGPSTRHSHEQCARAALRALALMGLDAPPPASATASATAAASAAAGAGAQPAHMAMGGPTAAPATKPGVISNGLTE